MPKLKPIVTVAEYATYRGLALGSRPGEDITNPLAKRLKISSHEAHFIIQKIESHTPEDSAPTFCSFELLENLRTINSSLRGYITRN